MCICIFYSQSQSLALIPLSFLLFSCVIATNVKFAEFNAFLFLYSVAGVTLRRNFHVHFLALLYLSLFLLIIVLQPQHRKVVLAFLDSAFSFCQ